MTHAVFTPKQHNWRWYENDGAEPTNPLADENVKPTGIQQGDVLRLRVCIKEEGGAAGSNQDLQVEYSVNETDWYSLGGQGAVDKKWRWKDGLATEHNTIAGAKLSCTTENGAYHEQPCTNFIDIGASVHHEMDITIENYNADAETTYYFRIMLEGSEVPLATGSTHPQVQTAAGGVLHERDISESLGVADAIATTMSFSRDLSESVGVGDALERIGSYGRDLAESIGIGDMVTRSLSTMRSVSESLSIGDAVEGEIVEEKKHKGWPWHYRRG